MVLDEPDGIEAHLVREHALLDRLLDDRVVIDHGPLHLIRQAQSHPPASLECLVSCLRDLLPAGTILDTGARSRAPRHLADRVVSPALGQVASRTRYLAPWQPEAYVRLGEPQP